MLIHHTIFSRLENINAMPCLPLSLFTPKTINFLPLCTQNHQPFFSLPLKPSTSLHFAPKTINLPPPSSQNHQPTPDLFLCTNTWEFSLDPTSGPNNLSRTPLSITNNCLPPNVESCRWTLIWVVVCCFWSCLKSSLVGFWKVLAGD